MQIYEAAEAALRDLQRNAHLRDIFEQIVSKGYFRFGAADPIRALGVAIDRHAKGVTVAQPALPTLFFRAGPATYGLLETLDGETQKDLDLDAQIAAEAEREGLDASLLLERELQRWIYRNFEQTSLSNLGYGPLQLFAPAEQRAKLGRFHTGAVGEIDFLLKTSTGDFVVLELKRESDDQTVGQICRYWGWVKDTLAGEKRVFGLILAQQVNEALRYAIKATNSDINVRTLTIEASLGPAQR